MKSLRQRAVVGSILWAMLSIAIGVFGLASFLNVQTLQRFDALLQNRHTQVSVATVNNHSNPEFITRAVGDPVYERPFSGEYWQAENDAGEIFVSASLVDSLLPAFSDNDGSRQMVTYAGPGGITVRAVQQQLTFDDGSTWNVQVASSTATLTRDRANLRRNLVAAFSVVSMIGILGAFLQASATLQPLSVLRYDVSTRWETGDTLHSDAYPLEVAPLVDDINDLLERNHEIVKRSRRQAADLAHAIKTPSAIMRNELEKLRADGEPVDASLDALDRLDAQLKRSFARMRADGGNTAVKAFTELDTSLNRMTRAFTALATNQGKTLSTEIAPTLKVRMDQNDFEEVMGNLLDNALKWCDTRIHVSAYHVVDTVEIVIEDDGLGIPEEELAHAATSGRRLDTSKPGTGLGLAIASDLCQAYGGTLTLSSSAMGGLRVHIALRSTRT